MKFIPLDFLVAEIERKIMQYEIAFNNPSFASYEASLIAKGKYRKLLDIRQFIDTLEVKEVDLELITGWFDHVAQMADDRKTLNGEVMEDWAALDEIKCLAKNSSEFITKHYKAQKGE